MKQLSIVALDDDPGDLELLKRYLSMIQEWEIHLSVFHDWESIKKHLQTYAADIIFLDYVIGNITGVEIVKILREQKNEKPIIVLTGRGDEKVAVEIMRSGANDYLIKDDITPDILRRSIENAMAQYKLKEEKKILEAELFQSQKMESIGTLVGGIAHDFNNMLTAMIGFVDLGLLQTQEENTKKYFKSLNKISKQMAELIKQLLNFARKNNQEQVFYFHTIFDEIRNILLHTIPKNIQLKFSRPKEKLILKGLPSTFHQVMMNLCINAIDSMPEGGTLSVKSKYVILNSEHISQHPSLKKGDYIIIEVQDTGCGIEQSKINRIFEPFFTTKQLGSKKGTGLGLAVVWQNIKLHNGVITVDSKPNEGTTFRIYIPVKPGEILIENLEKQKDIYNGKETILIVDDESAIIELASFILEQRGYTIYTASNGSEALEIYARKKNDIDLVLLDISMPIMDGETCFNKLKEINSQVHVIFMSGHDVRENTEKFLTMGAKGILQKPFHLKELSEQIRNVLDNLP